jgi:hypothetical protein
LEELEEWLTSLLFTGFELDELFDEDLTEFTGTVFSRSLLAAMS